ncbi:MAG: hypothetical protein J1F32_01350 [Erysipelotrichales bacterium]|nr:hypothetical protein [Erysipelotrichales bacterium]
MKKETKRKALVVAGAIALIAAVGTTAGSTFAKYTDSAKATGNATVAKWGFTLSVNADKLFGSMYDVSTEVVSTNDKNTVVVGKDGAIVVAPGTSGSMNFSIKGRAEVDALVKVEIGDEDFKDVYLKGNEGTEVEDVEYYPIEWKLSKTSGGAAEKVNNDKVAETIDTWASETRYEAGTSADVDISYELEWRWVFEHGSTPEDKAKYNGYDTILGKWANGTKDTTNYDANVTIALPTISLSVEQINTATK